MPGLFIQAGCPIRRSPAELARQLTEAYRSRAASFIGPQRLGIHRAPLVALTTIPLPPQRVVGIPQVTLYSFVNVLSGFPPGRPGPVASARRVRGQDLSRKGRPSGRPRAHQTLLTLRLFGCRRRLPQTLPFLSGRVYWWSRGDSNPRHPPCKGGALPAELRPHSGLASGGRWWTRTTDLGLIRTAL